MVNDISKRNAKAAGICSIIILLCGIGNLIAGILWHVNLELGHNYGAWDCYGCGFYSGIPLIIAGALGLALWAKRNRGLIKAFLAFCIVAFVLAAIQTFVTGAVYSVLARLADCLGSNSHNCLRKAIYLTWTVLSSIGGILTIAGSITVFSTVCCNSRPAAENPGVVDDNQQPPVSMNAYVGSAQPYVKF